MGIFRSYGVRANEVAMRAFKQYREAEAILKAAEDKVKEYPEIFGQRQTDEYMYESKKAKLALMTAKEDFKQAQGVFQAHARELAEIRKELAEAVEEEFSAKPEKLDSNTLELLKSGMLKVSDYQRLMDKARAESNHTMIRLIGKYATDEAHRIEDEDGAYAEDAVVLRGIGHVGTLETGNEYLSAFDTLIFAYERTVNNPAMIDSWESLTSEVIESM